MKRVLVTLASGTLATGVIRSLRVGDPDIHIIGVDSSKYHIHQSEADELHLVPRADDPRFVDILVEIAKESNADFIWPMHDAEIGIVSENAAQIPVHTWVPPVEVCQVSRDKLATAERMQEAEVPAPPTVLIETQGDLKDAYEKLGPELWLRARSGAGGKGAFRAASIEHATYWMDINEGWGTFIAAEAIPDHGDYSWESLWKDGKLIAYQDETRIVKGNPGISQSGVKSRGVLLRSAPAEVTRVAEAAVRALMPEPDGMFRVDMVGDANGVPRVTEVDAGRFGSGGVAYWHDFDYNFAYEALRMAFNEPINYEIPVANPIPGDMASITGLNQGKTLLKMSEVDPLVKELEERR